MKKTTKILLVLAAVLSVISGVKYYIMAKDYIDMYFAKYPAVKEYMDSNIQLCKTNGFVKTYFGRIRYIPEINNSNFNL